VVELVSEASLPPALRRVLAHGYGWLRTGVTLLDLAYRSRRTGEAVELWVGDSHAMWCNATATVARVSRAPTGAYVWHLGPRLMWSLARDGFPGEVRSAFRALGVWARADVVPVFVVGEIDVRCHLAGRRPDMRFVATYAERVEGLVRELRARSAVLVVPPPPSSSAPLSDLPVRGDLGARLAAFQAVREALGRAAGPATGLLLLDATDDLLGDDGLRAELTDDKVHTNREGVAVLRRRLTALLEEVG
jgi:hypothetical protein